MVIILITVVLVLLAIKLIFNPIFDQLPLTYNHERWLVLWYNKWSWENKEIRIDRTWTKIFCIEK